MTSRVPAGESRAPSAVARLARALSEHGAVAALILLVAANALATPNFATAANLKNILVQVSATVLIGVGMTLVMSTGGVDLSVGSVMALAAAVVAALPGGSDAVTVAGGLAVAGGVGLLNGVVIGGCRVEPFIATLGTQITCRSLAQIACQSRYEISAPGPWLTALGRASVGPIPVPVVIAALAVGLGVLVVRSSAAGRYLVAIGNNEGAAYHAGVPVLSAKVFAYTASGAVAGLAGLIESGRIGGIDPSTMGGGIEFGAIAGAVIGGNWLGGGRASVLGTTTGVLLLVVIGAALNMLLVPAAWALPVQAGVILAAVAAQRTRRPV